MTTAAKTHKSRPPRRNLTSLLDEHRAAAEAVQVTPEQLAAWYEAQLAWQRAEVEALGDKLTRNARRMVDHHDKRWPKYWEQEAKWRYEYVTLQMLEQRGHILVCVSHGFPAMGKAIGPFDASCSTGAPESDWRGLSLRGVLDGSGSTGWERYCVQCAANGPVATLGKQLLVEWEKTQ